MRASTLLTCGVLVLLCACTGTAPLPEAAGTRTPSVPATATPSAAGASPPALPAEPAATASAPDRTEPAPDPVAPAPTALVPVAPSEPPAFDADAAFETVELLADGIGPREATSGAYREAADLVADRFRDLGYEVDRQRLRVPEGNSWGVPVPAGRTQNVVATAPGFRADRPHRMIGAHLDTVPQAPGAEDNGSGVGILLELARIASQQPPEVPVVLVAFGAEEPRGPGDSQHHFGSRHLVSGMPDRQRAAMLGMLSLDRVGVGAPHVPVCHGGLGSAEVRDELVAAARAIDIRVRRCENRTSDHWSFEKAGVPSARLGSIPYAAYHSSADLPAVIDVEQLERVGRIAAEWMLSPM